MSNRKCESDEGRRKEVIFFFKQKTAYEMRISDWSSDVCSSDLLRLALRGRDPFTDEATQVEFVDLAMVIYSAVVAGMTYAGTDLAALRDIAAALDVEDAECARAIPTSTQRPKACTRSDRKRTRPNSSH